MKRDYFIPTRATGNEGHRYIPHFSRRRHDYSKLFPQMKNATTQPQNRKNGAATTPDGENILELLE